MANRRGILVRGICQGGTKGDVENLDAYRHGEARGARGRSGMVCGMARRHPEPVARSRGVSRAENRNLVRGSLCLHRKRYARPSLSLQILYNGVEKTAAECSDHCRMDLARCGVREVVKMLRWCSRCAAH